MIKVYLRRREKMCKYDTRSVGHISSLYKCLMEGVKMLGLSRTLRIKHEDDPMGVSLDGGPAALVLIRATDVPQLHLGLDVLMSINVNKRRSP